MGKRFLQKKKKEAKKVNLTSTRNHYLCNGCEKHRCCTLKPKPRNLLKKSSIVPADTKIVPVEGWHGRRRERSLTLLGQGLD